MPMRTAGKPEGKTRHLTSRQRRPQNSERKARRLASLMQDFISGELSGVCPCKNMITQFVMCVEVVSSWLCCLRQKTQTKAHGETHSV